MPVYFIRWSAHKGPIKIGWADSVDARLAQIQAMSPVPLVILNTLDCEPEQEKAIHFHFDHLRLYGEWFKPKKELLRFIENPCRVIDRRVKKSYSQKKKCKGYYVISDRLTPCKRFAIDGSEYCKICDSQTPKGMPSAYLEYSRKQEEIAHCRAKKTNGELCNRTIYGKEYCYTHDPSKAQCQAINGNGTQCSKRALPDDTLCKMHLLRIPSSFMANP